MELSPTRKSEIVFGIHPVIEAIKSGKEIDKIVLQNGVKSPQMAELHQLIKTSNIPFQYVPLERINRITFKNHQGVVAIISPVAYYKIEDVLPDVFERGETPLIVILDCITDVGNLGAIVRTAECAGVHAIIIPDKGSAQINSHSIKASAGAIFKIPICRASSLKETALFLRNSGLQVVACTEKAKENYVSVDYSLPTAFVFGSEETGISPELLRHSDKLVAIPLAGEISSLNVSVSAGVILFEATRQRGFTKG